MKPVYLESCRGADYFLNKEKGWVYTHVYGIFYFIPENELPQDVRLAKILVDRERVGKAYNDGVCSGHIRPVNGF